MNDGSIRPRQLLPPCPASRVARRPSDQSESYRPPPSPNTNRQPPTPQSALEPDKKRQTDFQVYVVVIGRVSQNLANDGGGGNRSKVYNSTVIKFPCWFSPWVVQPGGVIGIPSRFLYCGLVVYDIPLTTSSQNVLIGCFRPC